MNALNISFPYDQRAFERKGTVSLHMSVQWSLSATSLC